MLKHVMVPLDGSTLAEAALKYATEVVDPAGEITLFSVVNVPELPIYDFYPTPVAVAQEYEAAVVEAVPRAREYLQEVADKIRRDAPATINIEVSSGDPATSIIEAATSLKIDSIVMSTHGRSGLGRWLFGSVTQRVLEAALCPVLVVPSQQKIMAASAQAMAESQT
jgi:nucleotide-binding universal stress UspA family protein